MIMWCGKCGNSMEYRHGCGLKWPHFRSTDPRPICGQCSTTRREISFGITVTDKAAQADQLQRHLAYLGYNGPAPATDTGSRSLTDAMAVQMMARWHHPR